MFRFRPRTALRGLLLLGVALSLFALAACGGDDEDGGGNGATPTTAVDGDLDYGDLSGSVVVDGSSTVFLITQAMAEEFAGVSKVQVKVGISGTGGGFEKFCRGDSQVSDASRPIKDSEVAACAANGIDDIVEFQVAIDALTVVVNPENDWAQCMTVEQLTNAFKAGGATKWSDLDPSWPDENIVYYYPGADSGTFDYFVEAIIGEEEGANHRADGTSSENDNILVAGVEGDKNAIGYFGFAYYQEAGQELYAAEVDGGEGCVAPAFENALDGSYQPLSRPLFIYTRESFLEERPEVLGFINFYYEILDEIVTEVGYVTMPGDLKQSQVDKFAAYLP